MPIGEGRGDSEKLNKWSHPTTTADILVDLEEKAK